MDRMDVTVAILAGGNSTRFNSDKASALFRGRPLVKHMLEIARSLSRHTMIVVSNETQADMINELVTDTRIEVDPDSSLRCALTGAITAFEMSESRRTLLLPVDTPLANRELLKALIELAPGHGAVVPSWPNGDAEPLHAVYLSEHAYARGLRVMEQGKTRMQDLLDALSSVLYIQTNVLRVFDPELLTFANINTEAELKELEQRAMRMG